MVAFVFGIIGFCSTAVALNVDYDKIVLEYDKGGPSHETPNGEVASNCSVNTKLDLSYNKFRRLSKGHFATEFGQLPNLEILVVTFCGIKYVDKDAFIGAPLALKVIDLSDNNIASFRNLEVSFYLVKHLRKVSLFNNPKLVCPKKIKFRFKVMCNEYADDSNGGIVTTPAVIPTTESFEVVGRTITEDGISKVFTSTKSSEGVEHTNETTMTIASGSVTSSLLVPLVIIFVIVIAAVIGVIWIRNIGLCDKTNLKEITQQ